MSKFTEQQIKNWKAYEKVRRGGRWNMFDLRAQQATGLSPQEYTFVMGNFEALEKQAKSS